MSNDSGRVISFSLKTKEKRQEVDEYAIAKGFAGAGDLARVALMQYIAKYPLKNQNASSKRKGQELEEDAKTVQSCEVGEGLKLVPKGEKHE